MTDDSNNIKKIRDRSVAYPGIGLSDAIEFTERLRNSMGKGPYSRDQVAKALGHPNLSGPAARKVAALVHYGLLERSGNTYAQGQLAQEICVPLSDEQKSAAIQRAALTPKLFASLYTRYEGQALPSMLPNIIVRDGVGEGVANEVAKTFIETLSFAHLLENGVVVRGGTASSPRESDAPQLPAPVAPAAEPHSFSGHGKGVPPDSFLFELNGGIRLSIPRTKSTSEAIADGELKVARQALSAFADKFMGEDKSNADGI